MSNLLDARFPLPVSKGSSSGPAWAVTEVALSSGHRGGTGAWGAPLRRYEVQLQARHRLELAAVLELYLVAGGPLRGFRLHDWTDDSSAPAGGAPNSSDQLIGTGDGETTAFQLVKRYSVGASEFLRPISKPIAESVLVAVGGTPASATIDTISGVVTLADPAPIGLPVTAGFRFDVPVRFDGALPMTSRGLYGDIPTISLKELRL